jgi:hypothetical protein
MLKLSSALLTPLSAWWGRRPATSAIRTRARRAATLLCSLLGLACNGGDTNTGADETESQRRLALYACEEKAFLADRPLQGPGFDRSRGGLLGEPQPSYVVFASQAYPRAGQRELFGRFVQAISAQLDSTPGMLAYSFGTDAGCGVGRSLSIWASEATLFEYAMTGAHAQAMSRGSEYFDSFKTSYWSTTADELLAIDWDKARQVLEGVSPIWYE